MEEKMAAEEAIAQLINLAVSGGRRLQSSQTGLIHYQYEQKWVEKDESIPLYENFLFAYALLRKEVSLSTKEGKKILENLFSFYNEKEKNFPLYLHQYPRCVDRFLSLKLLVVFYYLMTCYDHHIDRKLLERITQDMLSSVSDIEGDTFCDQLLKACLLHAYGKLFSDQKMKQSGDKSLSFLLRESKKTSFASWLIPSSLFSCFVSLQLIDKNIDKGDWKHFWKKLFYFWDKKRFSYVGPALSVWQEGKEPKVTGYDLLMGFLHQRYSTRSFDYPLAALHAALIQPCIGKLPKEKEEITGTVGNLSWKVFKKERFSYSFLDKIEPLSPSIQKTIHPFYLIWGDENWTNTFVCQCAKSCDVFFKKEKGEVIAIFDLFRPVKFLDPNQAVEIAFFCNIKERFSCSKEHIFELDEPLNISCGKMQISLTFHVEEGKGKFKGIIDRSNRFAQEGVKGISPFNAFDYRFSLRTIRRFGPCKVSCFIRFTHD